MDKAKLVLRNGMHTVVPITLTAAGVPPPAFEHQGRHYQLHYTLVGTGAADIRAVYSEVEPKERKR